MIPQALGDRAARALVALIEDAEACPECGWVNAQHGQHLDGCVVGVLHREYRALTPGEWGAAEWPPAWARKWDSAVPLDAAIAHWEAIHPDVTLAVVGPFDGAAPGRAWIWMAMKPGMGMLGRMSPGDGAAFASGYAPDRLAACTAAELAGTPEKARAAKTTVEEERTRGERAEQRTEISDPEALLRAAGSKAP